MNPFLLSLMLVMAGCLPADRCGSVDSHVGELQRHTLLDLDAQARPAVLGAQREALVALAQRDCAHADGPYTSCLLAATDLPSVSACSGGAR